MAVYPQSRTFLFSGRLDSSGGIVEKTLIPVPGQALSRSAVSGGICFGKTDAYGCIRSVLKGSASAEQTRFFITRAGDRRWINLIDNNVTDKNGGIAEYKRPEHN